MKNILQVIGISTAIITLPMTGSEKPSSKTPWYENDKVYRAGVKVIDVWAKCKSSVLLFGLKKAQTKSMDNDPKDIIMKKLMHIAEDIHNEESKAIIGLFDHYKITSDNQQLLKAWINIGIAAEDQYNQEPSLVGITVQQDSKFPKKIFSIFKRNNIHPQAFNLLVGKVTNGACADTYGSEMKIGSFTVNTDQSISCEDVTMTSAPTIIISPAFLTYSLPLQKAILAHESTHAKEHHALKASMLLQGIAQYGKTPVEEVINSTHANALRTIYERQADVLSALQNNRSAALMRMKSAAIFYPGHLHWKHYSQMADIDELYKLLVKFHDIEQERHN